MTPSRSFLAAAVTAFVVLLTAAPDAHAQSGHVLNGVSPIDQSMSGAGTAAALDAVSSINWNPAGIVTLQGNQLDLSLQLMRPNTHLISSIDAGAMGTSNPPIQLTGETPSKAGVFPIPAAGFVYRPEASRWALGLGAVGVGGFGVKYEAGNPQTQGANPITFPQQYGGFGAINSEFALFQIMPTFAYALSDRISIGVTPTINIGMLEVNPFPATSPDQTGYPGGPQSTTTGFGFQASVFAHDFDGFNAVLSFKSTQNFKAFEFESGSRTFSYDMDYPMIVSGAVAYTGFEKVLLAADVRYIDFANTNGFQEAGFTSTGAVTGFGWKSIVVAALGLQYELTDRLPVRLGYAYNANPIPDKVAFYNVASPAIVQHHISGGLSYRVNDRFMISGAVQYGVMNEVSSEMQSPFMMARTGNPAVPGTRVTNKLGTLTGILGISFNI